MKKKVLLIDDEKDFALLLKMYFSKSGIELFIAHTLAEGMRLFEHIMPDVLILDNNLPDGLGWKTTPSLLARNPELRVILVSAYPYDHNSLKQLPSVKIMEKPVSLEELAKLMN